MSRWVPYAISHFVRFSRNPVGFIALINSFDESAKKEVKKDLRELCQETVEIMRYNMMAGLIGPPNSKRVQDVKGGNSPTYDTGDLAMALKVRVVQETKSEGVGFFVGVPENAGYGPNHPGPVTSNFFNKVSGSVLPLIEVANLMLVDHTTIIPRSGIEVKVPARDFIKPGLDHANALFAKEMKGAVARSLEELRNG